MKIVLLGATGATGKLLAKQLVDKKKHKVTAFVRRELPELRALEGKHFKQIQSTVLDMNMKELQDSVKDSDAVLLCLGHNITFKGMFGQPRKLVLDSLKKIVKAVDESGNTTKKKKKKVVLMNSTGVENKDNKENYSVADRILIPVIYHLLPPHKDQTMAAEYLRKEVGGEHPGIEWVSVRPGDLLDEIGNTRYDVEPSPLGGVLFGDGKTDRWQVAHFMSSLIDDDGLWNKWKGKMPVLYKQEEKN